MQQRNAPEKYKQKYGVSPGMAAAMGVGGAGYRAGTPTAAAAPQGAMAAGAP